MYACSRRKNQKLFLSLSPSRDAKSFGAARVPARWIHKGYENRRLCFLFDLSMHSILISSTRKQSIRSPSRQAVATMLRFIMLPSRIFSTEPALAGAKFVTVGVRNEPHTFFHCDSAW